MERPSLALLAQLRDRPHRPRPQLDPSPAAPTPPVNPFSPFFLTSRPLPSHDINQRPSAMVGPRKRGADAEEEEELVALPSDEEDDEEEEE